MAAAAVLLLTLLVSRLAHVATTIATACCNPPKISTSKNYERCIMQSVLSQDTHVQPGFAILRELETRRRIIVKDLGWQHLLLGSTKDWTKIVPLTRKGATT